MLFRGRSIHRTLLFFTTFLVVVDRSACLPSSPTTFEIKLDFWNQAIKLGSALYNYTENLIQDAAASHSTAMDKLNEFKSTVGEVVASAAKLRDEVQTHLDAHNFTLDALSESLSKNLALILDDLEAAYPLPNNVTHHEERVRVVSRTLLKAEDVLIQIMTSHGASESTLRARLEDVRPQVEKVLVVTGDLIERYPILFEIVLFCGATLLIPEAWFLRPLLSLFGFGPYGPIKGSPAAWAQRTFWGKAVAKGSWFAHLQRAGAKGVISPGFWKSIVHFIVSWLTFLWSYFKFR